MPLDFPTQFFGLQNALIIDKIDIYKGLPQGNGSDPALKISKLGTPVYSDLLLKGGKYTDENGKEFTFKDIYFDTVILIIDQEKNIITTQIQGRNGTVKEYIGLGDYRVSINAVLNFDNGRYDRDAVADLKDMLTAPISIKCVSWYLQLWDIDEITIQGYTIPQQVGEYSRQPVVIGALSDKPTELTQY